VKVLVEAGQRADAPVQCLGRGFFRVHCITERQHIDDGDRQHLRAVLGPGNANELDERHHVFAVRAPRMTRLSALDPGFEDRRHGKIETLDALPRFRCELSGKYRRKRYRRI
jgi:hypothetical protein